MLVSDGIEAEFVAQVNLDGVGADRYAAIILNDYVPRAENEVSLPRMPELAVLDTRSNEVVYRFRPSASRNGALRTDEDFSRIWFGDASLGIRLAWLQISDANRDGLEDIVVTWQAVGANPLSTFTTVTHFSNSGIKTVAPLPPDYQPARPGTRKYHRATIANAYSESESVIVHSIAWHSYKNGRWVMAVPVMQTCNACFEHWEVVEIVFDRRMAPALWGRYDLIGDPIQIQAIVECLLERGDGFARNSCT